VKLPLLRSADPDRAVLWSDGRRVNAHELMQRVAAVAREPRAGRYLINLCERRDAFLVACCAALVRGHTNVLPSSRAQGVVDEITSLNADSYRCDDHDVRRAWDPAATAQSQAHSAAVEAAAPAARDTRGPVPEPVVGCDSELPENHVAVIAFTSGSTGAPQGHTKLWRSFARTSELNASRMRECLAPLYGSARPWIVATVPPQHMYGLETSILLPLLSDMAVHAGRPLFPADIAAALAEVPEPRVLVTTPVHMRALAASGQRLPPTALVVSATAPLDAALAQSIERQFETTVLEMFGSTETCVIATRRTSCEEAWHLYPEVQLEALDDGVRVEAPWFHAPMRLQDLIEVRPGGRFIVRGRNADMVEVAGKRASLADLTRRLLSVPGVEDAVVFQPSEATKGAVRRVAALVVAPTMSAEAICKHLARSVDPAFIPRPLVLVATLPRNDVGKLPREQLLAALRGPK
jgi:acyl-coenzyme A synthetase/AMP-(fatty) acid ligase